MPGSQELAWLLPLQGLLKKHEAFETDFTVHKDRVNDVCTNGQDLVKKVSLAHGYEPLFPVAAPSLYSVINWMSLFLFLLISVYLALLGLSGGVQALSCSIWDVVP